MQIATDRFSPAPAPPSLCRDRYRVRIVSNLACDILRGFMVSSEAMSGLAQSWIEPVLRVFSALLVVWHFSCIER